MDFLVFSRSTPAAAVADDDDELNEQHWTYMDGFADGMTARGPTLGPDRQSWTGSLHVVDLPDPEAAREFVAREPYNQAGLFEEHLTWRFVNVLGRTMWQFKIVCCSPVPVVSDRRVASTGGSAGTIATATSGSGTIRSADACVWGDSGSSLIPLERLAR